MFPFQFSEELLNNKNFKPKKDEIRKVLEGERFLPKLRLTDDSVGTGDLFLIKNNYYLNIRPQCDLLRNNEINLYCIKGKAMTRTKESQTFDKKYGHFEERNNQVIIPFVNDGKIIVFYFKDFDIYKFDTMKDHRIGRILPPYIIHIQQRFSLYLQRQGLTRIHNEAIGDCTT
jgi:hypothetical protein